MINKLKNIIKRNKIIFNNIFSLGTLQIFNYIIPLITLPYILRIFGPEKYGLIAFSFAFAMYFMIFINYGFNLSATKDIADNKNDNIKISKIFWNIIFIKLILFLISILIFTLIISTFDIFKDNYLIFIFSFLIVIGEVCFPIWLFQGMEKMKYITIINVIIKSLFLIPIFTLIKTVDDISLYPLIISSGFIFSGLIAFIMGIKIFEIKFIFPTITSVKYYLYEGWHIFISTVFVSLYTTSTIFLLGIFTNNIVVGYYATAEKLVKSFQGLMGPISQAIYPNIIQKLKLGKRSTIVFLQKITKVILIFTFIISLILFFGAEIFVNLLFGKEFYNSIILVKVLSFLPLIIGLSNVFGILTMLNFGYKKEFSKILIFFALISIFVSILLTIIYQGLGMAISVLLIEGGITFTMYVFLLKKGINLLNFKK